MLKSVSILLKMAYTLLNNKWNVIAGERSSVDPPKEQRPRKLSGKRTVITFKTLERSHCIENKNK